MAKGRATDQARPDAAPAGALETVGPPLLLLALGFVCVVASLPLVAADGIPGHVVGYVVGALIPILIIGAVRRVDLSRRRSPYYVPRSFLQPALFALAISAVVVAGLQIWPIATELAS
ncbi:MAG TPA: hypothetical protein VNQ33_11190 [Acidimicrobiales bacterium]|nr:hypothetical protein [Acidimicrobiales bacterium]